MPEADPNRILLVEDNPADVFLIKEALKTHGIAFNLQWFSDGEQAVLHIDHFQYGDPAPDLILLDLNLPKVDGKEVLARIRGSLHFLGIPVAILTSSDSVLDRQEIARLGANLYIKKPPTLDEFMELGGTIKELLEESPRILPTA